jgi:hypothetical protein
MVVSASARSTRVTGVIIVRDEFRLAVVAVVAVGAGQQFKVGVIKVVQVVTVKVIVVHGRSLLAG